jgi:RNA polymerase sigma-70 factor (ECF subfamily)
MTDNMQFTRQSLLLRAQGGEQNAWHDLITLYRPLIVGWLRRHNLRPHELEDLSQTVLLAVVKHLPSFAHSGRRGAFRCWLRTIARNALADFWQEFWKTRGTPGDLDPEALLRQIEDPDSNLNRLWDEEHDRYLLRCLLDMMDLEFEESTVKAFHRLALDGAPGTVVAAELGLSVGAVYVARSRVLKRLREEAEGLLD